MNRRMFFGNGTLLALAPLAVAVRRIRLAMRSREDVKITPVEEHSPMSADHMNGLVRQVNELATRVNELESL